MVSALAALNLAVLVQVRPQARAPSRHTALGCRRLRVNGTRGRTPLHLGCRRAGGDYRHCTTYSTLDYPLQYCLVPPTTTDYSLLAIFPPTRLRGHLGPRPEPQGRARGRGARCGITCKSACGPCSRPHAWPCNVGGKIAWASDSIAFCSRGANGRSVARAGAARPPSDRRL